ncbi:hypothetical protein Vadar_017690 [Vaccinium darrowii]|uniref:Uncharacterized protein n=1 Tax=Vaccinium darrowii TaxID=229202 RepID=A0ACB7YFE6_9ERIC|nr:hypothetical protein Vadar_017690 [Vaccinium darrowii]
MKEFQDQLVQKYEKEEFDATEYKRVEEGMRQATMEEEEYWRSKSRVSWLRLRDKHTAFFHAKKVQIRAANKVHGLEDRDGMWKVPRGEVEDVEGKNPAVASGLEAELVVFSLSQRGCCGAWSSSQEP